MHACMHKNSKPTVLGAVLLFCLLSALASSFSLLLFPSDTLMCMFVPQLRNVLHDQLHHGGDGGDGYCVCSNPPTRVITCTVLAGQRL
uniref:Putative secreted protein n=1 Tax=Anopheles darlingi TaxID=43151 RepID=A0A2M4DQI0_ANODA